MKGKSEKSECSARSSTTICMMVQSRWGALTFESERIRVLRCFSRACWKSNRGKGSRNRKGIALFTSTHSLPDHKLFKPPKQPSTRTTLVHFKAPQKSGTNQLTRTIVQRHCSPPKQYLASGVQKSTHRRSKPSNVYAVASSEQIAKRQRQTGSSTLPTPQMSTHYHLTVSCQMPW